MELLENYKQDMKEYLKDEYEAYIESFEHDSYAGLRVNTNKISVEEFLEIFPFDLEPIPWTSDGFYYNSEDPVTKHPYYYAGLYYIQEPSAMLPAQVLPVEEGEWVLDTCAAPGGKSTKLATKLKNTGVLVSNDISASRCQALIKNLERFGTKNMIVTSCDIDKLVEYFPNTFDKILIDAPCSGQGMFRKEKHLIKAYAEHDDSYYAPIQKGIIENALKLLKNGGKLVYSTCTFSVKEDEEVIQYALSLCPELRVLPIEQCTGFVSNEYGTKLFPHRIKGEGHFVSLLQKGDAEESSYKKSKEEKFDYEAIHLKMKDAHQESIKDNLYLVPNLNIDTKGLRILRSGLLLGEQKKNRFEPSGALGLALTMKECNNCINLKAEDTRVIKYLKGETIDTKDLKPKDGLALICVDGFPLGFAKVSKGVCKNKYPKGWIYR
ncbi:MAG: RsmB/NOP family class I SAM-dependent RNA methyltransferase [Firmicutes bacterium]|nr:RsmB/NOP family class I SAM-dependent RNA methyltransferase [Bacillota bacterium]